MPKYHDPDEDFQRVSEVWLKIKRGHFIPNVVLFEDIRAMRKEDRGIDWRLRRLLDSKVYQDRIRLYGGPCRLVPRFPFRWKGRKYGLIQIFDSDGKVLA